jgi:hypothetical protein
MLACALLLHLLPSSINISLNSHRPCWLVLRLFTYSSLACSTSEQQQQMSARLCPTSPTERVPLLRPRRQQASAGLCPNFTT